MFVTFEGGEGSGKSTQVKRLAALLERAGHSPVVTREPGGTPLAETIRPLLVRVQKDDEDWDPLAETLLFYAARVQHWQTVIAPALAEARWVVSDRFADSTIVYQGIGKGLGVDYLQAIHRQLLGPVQPQLTFLLDLPPEIGLNRAASRNDGETRFEQLDMAFHHRLRIGFLQLAEAQAARFVVIDARQTADQVSAEVARVMEERFDVRG